MTSTNRLFFVSGMPRSCSTLLLNLLGQCPTNHVGPTSDLVELIEGVRSQWPHCRNFQAEGLENVEPRVRQALCGLLCGYYAGELAAGKAVFDKSRAWPPRIELLEEVLERRVQVLVTVRDIRDVVASFEKLYRKNPSLRFEGTPQQRTSRQTVESRARAMLEPDAMLGQAIAAVLDAFDRGLGDRLIVVPYRRLTVDPVGTVAAVHWRLGLEPFLCDPQNVEQLTSEDDYLHGFRNLHAVRPHVSPQEATWREILPERLASWLDREFADIQALAIGETNNGIAKSVEHALRANGTTGVCADHCVPSESGREQNVCSRGSLCGSAVSH